MSSCRKRKQAVKSPKQINHLSIKFQCKNNSLLLVKLLECLKKNDALIASMRKSLADD